MIDYVIERLELRRLLTIFINATSGNDTLIVDRDGTSGDIFVTLNGALTTRTVPVGETAVQISGLGGNDTIDVVDMDNLDLIVHGDADDDVITLAAGSGTSFLFEDSTIRGGGGNDTLIIDDTNLPLPPPPQPPFGETTIHSYSFDASTFSAVVSKSGGLGGPTTSVTPFEYVTIETVTLNAGVGFTSITVGSPGTIATLNINAGDGFDDLQLNNLAISTTINFNGQAGDDRVLISDSSVGVAGDTYTLDVATFDRTGFGLLNFSSVNSVTLQTHDAGADVTLLGSAAGVPVTVNGGAGDDVFFIGDGDYDTNIGGAVRVDGNGGRDFLSIDDSADTGSDSYSFTTTFGQHFKKGNMSVGLHYVEVEELSLNGSAASNAIAVTAVPAGLEVLNIASQGGNDAFTVAPLASTAIHLSGGSHTSADTLAFQNAASAGSAVLAAGIYTFESAGEVATSQIETLALPPAAPGVPDLAADDDSGISFADNITNKTQLSFSGSAAANHEVVLRGGATALGSATATAGGAWTIEASALPEGTHPISAAAREPLSGLTGAYSTALNVTIDTTAPPAPAQPPDLNTGSDTGLSLGDNITRDNTPQIDGSIPANHIARLFVDGALAASDTTTPGGTWTIVLGPLADGSKQVVVRVEDLAGNESGLSPALNLVIDTVAPAAPTVAPNMTAATDTGVSSSDNITRDATPTFTGARPADAAVHLVQGNVIHGQQLTVGTTSYSITTVQLDDGAYDFAALFEDVAGNKTVAGPTLAVLIDTVRPTLIEPAAFNFLTEQNLTYSFSEDVGLTISPADVAVFDLTHATTVPTASIALDYSANTARFTFPGFAGGILPDAQYRARMTGDNLTDVAGNQFVGAQFDFFFLNGDANRDGTVNLADFNILASNFGQQGRTFDQGDFNYDNIVNLSDFNLLAARFGTSVASMSPPSTPRIFSDIFAQEDAR